jgi:hypothetical protein
MVRARAPTGQDLGPRLLDGHEAFSLQTFEHRNRRRSIRSTSVGFESRALAAPSSAHLVLVCEMLEAANFASSKRKTKIQVKTPMR